MHQALATAAGPPGEAATSTAAVVDAWLAGLDQADGIYLVSPPRPFAHDEATFDAGLRLDAGMERIGGGLIAQLRREGCDFSLPAIEIGCGSGALSVGLARSGVFSRLVLSDPSPAFIAILQKRLAAHGAHNPTLRYALMAAEEVDRLPPESFGVIALRHTVHHVLDVEGFLAGAAAALRPGGFLVFEEPCMEALVLMAALCRLLPLAAAAKGITPTATQLEQNDLFCRTIEFYARRDVDKSQAEDKHLFRADEMIEAGRRAGFEVRFFSNCTFDGLNQDEAERRLKDDHFSSSFRDYLEHIIGFGPAFGDLWDKTIREAAVFVDHCCRGGGAPHYLATFTCRKL
jgi:2-polyprenyl-3-methyl-5-hydroxy-6-metoxy-1,4-benzoquinol methylase